MPALCKKKLQIGSGSCWECSAKRGGMGSFFGWDVFFLGGGRIKMDALRIMNHWKFPGLTLFLAGFWDLQTTGFEMPWFLG